MIIKIKKGRTTEANVGGIVILKKIKINNIRSYESQEIIFPKGSTLLCGDIGCGKTTILLAIEFALFGLQPSQKATSLLRNNKEDAYVSLECEIEDKNIVIERILKRNKKSITQDYSSITIDNEKYEESVTEIKSRILSLLNYPSEFAKKTNLLYKFTVYTPQEEMKQIVLESKDTRLNTLRHVFGIDKYKRIEENAAILTSKLRELIKINEAKAMYLERDKDIVAQKQKSLELLKKTKEKIDKEHKNKVEARKDKEKSLEEIQEKIDEKRTLTTEKEKTTILLSEKERQIKQLSENIKKLNEEVKEMEKISFDEQELSSINQRIKFQEEKEKEFQKEYMDIVGKINAEESKKREASLLRNKIANIEKCPTCLQNVSYEYKTNIQANSDKEIELSNRRIAELSQKKKESIDNIEGDKKVLDEFRSKKSSMEIMKIRLDNIKEKKKQIEDVEKNRIEIEKDLLMLKKHFQNLETAIKGFDKYDVIFKERYKELEKTKEEENLASIRKAEINKEIQFLENDIMERLNQIAEKESIKKETEKIRELEFWISNKFVNLILFTEKQVMTTLKEEFSRFFSQWFSILVSDLLSAKLNDDFSPIVEQKDYEIDYDFLSGGERTAIALAYRLALNQVINSVLSNIKTANLVILDEPTDGFSSQQLDKMRDVLSQLTAEQIIIVSHEPKIESFVENIIKIKKENGISLVENLITT